MTTHRFYVREPLESGGVGRLRGDQARQARRVLRLWRGAEIVVFDGTGHEYLARLEEPERDSWAFSIGDATRPEREPALRLIVGLAVLRNERFDMAIQKLTELGVAGIVPLMTERSMISYDDALAWEKRRTRLERITIEAAEQSERTTLPELHEPLNPAEFLEHHQEADIIALVERTSSAHLAELRPTSPAALLIGPEGGWAETELDAFARHAATTASLGALILRAETAAIVGAGLLLLRPAAAGIGHP
jgi:16S rRNA (uracil1498-N3)-methyltransferase